MMCANPYTVYEDSYVGCGQCLFCRINHAREWQHRLLLEASCWEVSIFATLTYDPMFSPYDGSLKPRDITLFLKRLRRRMEPLKIRYYCVGEYGEDTGLPHYHLALFGVGWEYNYCPERKGEVLYSFDNVVENSWKCGHVHVGEINHKSARYMTNYVTKFMNQEKFKALKGRHPEFSRMSLRPGIGAPAMVHIAETLLKKGFPKELIVSQLHYGNIKYPLGDYLKKILHVGRKGDVLAEFREGRSRLFDAGLEYIGWVDDRGMAQFSEDKDDGVVFVRADGDVDCSTRSHRLSKRKAKRFAIEANRKQFKQRRSI